MPQIANYVIYTHADNLAPFLQSGFHPIQAFSSEQIAMLPNKSALFNTQKALELLNRPVTDKEIAHTLSHIQCWQAIAENETLQDEDFALVAESAVKLVEDFQALAQAYANKYPSYGIIKLQRNGQTDQNERLFQQGDDIEAIIYGNIQSYNQGCALYLMRKDIAKKLTALLMESKPYWLANQFTEFHSPAHNIAQAIYLLGELHQAKLQHAPKNPLFSIIIPIYNVERYLKQCIESVLAQDYENYEIILIDDGSPDNSFDLCVHYAKKYKNIVLIHKINGGVSEARNAGIRIARGEYIMFLDSDDYWQGTNILEDLSKIIKHHYPDIIINYVTSVYEDNSTMHILKTDKNEGNFIENFKLLFQDQVYVGFPWTKIVKRSILIQNKHYFHPERTYEDMLWSFGLTQYLNTYAIYPEPFYQYRQVRSGSITNSFNKQSQKDMFLNFEDVIKHMKNMQINHSKLYEQISPYVQSIYDYTKQCYHTLLNEHDKESLNEMYQNFIKKGRKLNLENE